MYTWSVVCGVWCVVCGVWCVVCGVWCVVCGMWCVVCGVWCGVWGVWYVVCGVWCVVYGVWCMVCGVWCVPTYIRAYIHTVRVLMRLTCHYLTPCFSSFPFMFCVDVQLQVDVHFELFTCNNCVYLVTILSCIGVAN
jgi:hypothetical protein